MCCCLYDFVLKLLKPERFFSFTFFPDYGNESEIKKNKNLTGLKIPKLKNKCTFTWACPILIHTLEIELPFNTIWVEKSIKLTARNL